MFPGLVSELNLHGILRNLPINHPLLSSTIFTNPSVLVELRSQLESGDSKWMEASGILPHIELYKKLDNQQKVIAFPDDLEQRVEKVLEKKGVGDFTSCLKSLIFLVVTHLERGSYGGLAMPGVAILHTEVLHLTTWTLERKATLSEWSMLMRHIINDIEAKLNPSKPSIRDELHAMTLFNMGFEVLKLTPSKRKRRTTQIKLTTVLRLVREAEPTRTRALPFKPRKRSKVAHGSTPPSSPVHEQPPVESQATREPGGVPGARAPETYNYNPLPDFGLTLTDQFLSNSREGAQRGNFCATHGGFRNCKIEGCVRTDRGGGFCEVHRRGRLCKIEGCKKLSRNQGMCTMHIREEKQDINPSASVKAEPAAALAV
ncbi:hypothetical protein ON010_g7799 [Phytophthora cinnamomi]|nr:hypothetical protein ON010_g7799 [Phytophthora cinnamomi]